jgi:type VI protein secretion system component VasF
MATNHDEPLDPRLRDAIATLRDSAPVEDLWPEIAPHLAPRHPAGTLLLRWPSAIAAGLVIAAASVGGTLLLQRGRAISPTGSIVAEAPRADGNALAAFTPADAALQQAIQELEMVLGDTDSALDPKTREGITASLKSLDQAIADAATQQRAMPEDPRLARYLTTALQRKLGVLRAVTQRTAVRT